MATTYTITSTFAIDTTAVASQVNQNFTDVLTALNSFDASNCDDTTSLPLGCISGLTSSQCAATFFLDENDMASDSATAVSSQQALKAYADTKESTIVTQATASLFGSWTSLDSLSATLVKNATYKVGSDGFVFARSSTTGVETAYTDGSNPPTTPRCWNYGHESAGPSVMVTVKKDDYWKITDTGGGTTVIYWLPIGTGGCAKQ